jgi:hypothetical protein
MTVSYPTPAGLLVRGTVLVVPGRGETPETYARLGRPWTVSNRRVPSYSWEPTPARRR